MPSKYVPTGRPQGRKPGYRMSAQGKAAIGAKSAAAHAERKAKLELCDALISAIYSGKFTYARNLVNRWLDG